ncbi:MAG: hypothetical protein CMM84_01775 [Rhodothermaceae bacterium]|nr:hypothetical protein [Rhodothermaceae bacterium]MBC11945.1 hypothetical protein [Rhodothermaceae bacterium]
MQLDPKFSRQSIESLPETERGSRLRELEQALTSRLSEHQYDWNTYWQQAQRIVEELRGLGHDLWSHDYDGQRRHLWGWDYMKPDGAGLLQIQFDFEGTVDAFWRSEDPQLGVLRHDS